MLTYVEFKQQVENKMSKIFNECGVFFAFSNEQFDENKTPIGDGEKYAPMGAGGYLPSKNVPMLNEKLEQMETWRKSLFAEQVNLNEAISYELNNHEYGITYNISDTVRVLADYGVTVEQCQKVANSIDWSFCW